MEKLRIAQPLGPSYTFSLTHYPSPNVVAIGKDINPLQFNLLN